MLSGNLVFTNTTITLDGQSQGASYAIPFGNPNVYPSEEYGFFTISGTPTLSNSLSITNNGNPTTRIMMTFVSSASINLNGNTVTIFGISLTQEQASNPFAITVTWNGSVFNAVLSRIEIPASGVPNSRLAVMEPLTIKMNSGLTSLIPQNVTVSNVAHLLNVDLDHIWLVVDFNSGFIGRQDILIPYQGEATRVFGYISQQIAGVDDANLTIGIASSAGGGSSNFVELAIPANTAVNTVYTILPAAFVGPATFNANYYLSVESDKTTWGGRAMFTIATKRTV